MRRPSSRRAKLIRLPLVVTLLVSSAPPMLFAELVHRFSFDDGGRDAVTGASAELHGGATTADGCLRLDGVDDWAELPIAGALERAMDLTIETWVVWRGGGSWQRVFDFGTSAVDPDDGVAKGKEWLMVTPRSGGGRLEMHIETGPEIGGPAAILAAPDALDPDAIRHLVLVLRANTGRLYVDGREVAAGPVPHDISETAGRVEAWIGRSHWAPDPFFRGELHELRVRDDALDADEVRASFEAGPDELVDGQGRSVDAPWSPASLPLSTPWTSGVRPDHPGTEHPRPTLRRDRWQSLDGIWELELVDDLGTPPTGRTLRERILVPFPIESALSGVQKRTRHAWYRREVSIPPAWREGRLLLHFGAVDWRALVRVNGRQLAEHTGGYDPFSVEIPTEILVEGAQEILVGVEDPSDAGGQPRGKQVRRPEGIWYTSVTGIWQTVWLEPVPPTRITSLRTTTRLDPRTVTLTVEADGPTAGVAVEVIARRETDGSGTELGRAVGAVGEPIDVPVPAAGAWSPSAPELHGLEIRLSRGGEVIDSARSYFGVREVARRAGADGVPRLWLNGEPLFQMGPLDQGYWPDGLYTAPSDEALRFDVEQTKALGFNMTRKHAKVEPERWYWWCDRLGLLVWQDMPSGDNDDETSRRGFARELEAIIRARRNHPSIVTWVVFNEGWGQHEDASLVAEVRELDPGRLVSGVSGWHDRGQGDLIDVHCYPGPGWIEPRDGRAAVIGEYGGPGLNSPEHSWSGRQSWGYFTTRDTEELTAVYERMIGTLRDRATLPGLTAAVFTQWTDVEREINGLFTYDRRVLKVDAQRVREAHGSLATPTHRYRTLSPTALSAPTLWRITRAEPPERWTRRDFDDGAWSEAAAGFGNSTYRQGRVRTPWTEETIWLRRRFELSKQLPASPRLLVQHDDEADIWINGVHAARLDGWKLYHEEVEVSEAARATLRKGVNVIAVRCVQRGGDQYIDVGLVDREAVLETQPGPESAGEEGGGR